MEITSLKELKVKRKPCNKLNIKLLESSNYQLNKFFYKQIGKKYQWIDRLVWSDTTWQKYTLNKNLKTYILEEGDNLVGYFELIFNKESNECEIAYFGILEDFFSKGYGGYLLSEAIRLGFELKVKKSLGTYLLFRSSKCNFKL